MPDDASTPPAAGGATPGGMELGAKVRAARRARGLHQADLAAACHLSQSQISRIETGRHRVTDIRLLRRLAEVLDLGADDVGLAPPPRPWEAGGAGGTVAHTLDAVRGTTDPALLDLADHTLDDVVARYETTGPAALLGEVRLLYRMLHTQLDGRQPPATRARVFRLAARTAGTLAFMSVDLAAFTYARTHCFEAAELADAADDPGTGLWVAGTRSWLAYNLGRHREAADIAQAAVDRAPRHPQAIRLLANGRARAAARLGLRRETDEALDRAFTLSAALGAADTVTPGISPGVYGLARTTANAVTAYVALRDPEQAQAHARRIGPTLDDCASPWTRALVALDVATSLLTGPAPDVEQAMAIGATALRTSDAAPTHILLTRAAELAAAAARWRKEPAVRDYTGELAGWRDAFAEGRPPRRNRSR